MDYRIRAGAAGKAIYVRGVGKSCRFESTGPSYLQKNFSSGTPGTTWTWSCWVKRTKFAADQQPLDSKDNGNRCHLGFTGSGDKFSFDNYDQIPMDQIHK